MASEDVEKVRNIQVWFLRCEGFLDGEFSVSPLYFIATVFQRNVRIGNIWKRYESCLRSWSCSRDLYHHLPRHLALPGLKHKHSNNTSHLPTTHWSPTRRASSWRWGMSNGVKNQSVDRVSLYVVASSTSSFSPAHIPFPSWTTFKNAVDMCSVQLDSQHPPYAHLDSPFLSLSTSSVCPLMWEHPYIDCHGGEAGCSGGEQSPLASFSYSHSIPVKRVTEKVNEYWGESDVSQERICWTS